MLLMTAVMMLFANPSLADEPTKDEIRTIWKAGELWEVRRSLTSSVQEMCFHERKRCDPSSRMACYRQARKYAYQKPDGSYDANTIYWERKCVCALDQTSLTRSPQNYHIMPAEQVVFYCASYGGELWIQNSEIWSKWMTRTWAQWGGPAPTPERIKTWIDNLRYKGAREDVVSIRYFTEVSTGVSEKRAAVD
jgi:hypothetical protein